MNKYIGNDEQHNWWESDDNKHWRRINDEEVADLLREMNLIMNMAITRMQDIRPPRPRVRKIKPISMAEISLLESLVSAMPTAKDVEEDKNVRN